MKPIRVLLVEDDAADAQPFAWNLVPQFRVTHVTSLAAALARLDDGETDVILLDLLLPDSSGTDTVERIHAAAPDVPIVYALDKTWPVGQDREPDREETFFSDDDRSPGGTPVTSV